MVAALTVRVTDGHNANTALFDCLIPVADKPDF
jgi:hypothetical protein